MLGLCWQLTAYRNLRVDHDDSSCWDVPGQALLRPDKTSLLVSLGSSRTSFSPKRRLYVQQEQNWMGKVTHIYSIVLRTWTGCDRRWCDHKPRLVWSRCGIFPMVLLLLKIDRRQSRSILSEKYPKAAISREHIIGLVMGTCLHIAIAGCTAAYLCREFYIQRFMICRQLLNID